MHDEILRNEILRNEILCNEIQNKNRYPYDFA